MKVIFINDYLPLAKKHYCKEVKDGFALNFLIPKKLAVKATASELRLNSLVRRQKDQAIQDNQIKKEVWLATLKTLTLIIKGKSNEQGHLYSQVSGKIIKEQLKLKFGINLSLSSFKLVAPIKLLGEHVVQLTLGQEIINLRLKIIHD